MVVRFAPNVAWFKSKRSYRSDYFAAKPDKAVPKTVQKVVPYRSTILYSLGLLVI